MAVNFAPAGQGNARSPEVMPPGSKPHGHSCAEWSVAELVDLARGWVDSAPAMSCTIDGKRVKGLDNPVTSPYRVGPQVFCYTLARHDKLLANYLGPLFNADLSCIADGTRVFPAAEHGVYLMLEPLCAGRHTIRFTVQGYLDITYDLKVLR